MSKKTSLLLVFLCMSFIFIMSSMSGNISNKMSKQILTGIINNQEVSNSTRLFNNAHYIFRKASHFFEYFILAILLVNYLKHFKRSKYFDFVICVFLCFLYSVTDEVHQMFVANRTPMFKDCLIDTSGAVVGCLIFFFFSSIFKRKKRINY